MNPTLSRCDFMVNINYWELNNLNWLCDIITTIGVQIIDTWHPNFEVGGLMNVQKMNESNLTRGQTKK